MILIKPGVVFKRLIPEIYGIFGLIDGLWLAYKTDPVITSANDSKHMKGSKHYEDKAIDLRVSSLPSETAKTSVYQRLAHHLGEEYVVLYESKGTPNQHLHVHYRGKGWSS